MDNTNEEDKAEEIPTAEVEPKVDATESTDEEDREEIPELASTTSFDQISNFDGIEVNLG